MSNRRVFGKHDEPTLKQVDTCLELGAESFVLCADGHLGYSFPIGGVGVYRDKISPSGVGFDIGCGNLLITTDAEPDDVRKNISAIMDDIFRNISFGIGRVNSQDAEPPMHVVASDAWSNHDFLDKLYDMACNQFGTVGSGNHYVDIFIDDLDRVCVGVHFGSRGLGHKIATHFFKQVGAKDDMHAPPVVFNVNSQIGQDYIDCMKLAGDYAYAGRDWVCEYVVREILQAGILERVHNHHNFAWEEKHNGEKFWVVRKGATPAFPCQLGFVGGSMGDNAYIIKGRSTNTAREAFYSTVHGAGRVMSRMAARGKKGKPGLISREEMYEWVGRKGVELRGADLDEAPQAYRRLDEVLAYHEDTIEIVRTLRPIGVAMAGKDIIDPYKD